MKMLGALGIAMLATASYPIAAHAQVDQRAIPEQVRAERAAERARQVDQRALAQQLLGNSAADRAVAVQMALTLGAPNTGPELRAALITLLERNSTILEEARRRNVAVANLENPEFIAHVAHVVSQLEDPRAIPALAGALDSGSTLVSDALADFGEQAAPAVLGVVTSPDSRYSAVDPGLRTLRFMVEEAGTRPLSAGTLDQIRGAAQRHLMGKPYFTTLWRAIELAVALNDPGLRRIVESLASDPNEAIARGVTDPGLIEKTQKWAVDRLAGVPQPRYRSPAERRLLLDPLAGMPSLPRP